MWASRANSSCAKTLTSPLAVTSLPRKYAKVCRGDSVPMSVPNRLFRPAAAMLPMSQPTALKAKEAPAAAPELLLTAVPALLWAFMAVLLTACSITSPSVASTVLLST